MFCDAAVSVAVRRASGEVVCRIRMRQSATRSLSTLCSKIPLVRGLCDGLTSAGLFSWASLFAFRQADLLGPLAPAALGGEGLPGSAPDWRQSLRTWSVLFAWLFWLGLGLVLVLGGVPLIFAEVAKGLPLGAATLSCHLLGAGCATLLLAGYVSLVGHSSSLSALLAYHGAEHQVRAAYCANASLTVQQVRRYPPHSANCIMGRAVVVTLMGFGMSALMAYACAPVAVVLSAADGSWGHLMNAVCVRALAVVLALGPYGELKRLMAWATGVSLHSHPLVAGPSTWLCAASTTHPSEPHTEVALVALMRLMDAQKAGRASGYRAPVTFRRLADACVRLGQATQHRASGHGAKETRGA